MEVREPTIAYGRQKLTIEEYLEWENAATEKHEYYRGEIFAMSGAKMVHNHITSNLLTGLGTRLKGKPCKPFGSDTRVHIPSNTLFTYPDITVICGKEETLNDDGFNVLNPSVIFEVLSLSTAQYDRGEKFGLYRDVPSLKAYVLVHTDRVYVEAFHINREGHWELREYKSKKEVLSISAIDVAIPVIDIYEGVTIATE
ncbi:MAG: Uma2 family endonuclease [Taibaiella sp.]|nr:Uma2 family endonuclease [Taibaiella sp.]